MKEVRWSPHALRNLAAREIDQPEAEGTLAAPEAVAPGQPGRNVFMRRYFDMLLGQEMLLRIVVEETAQEIVVVTLYKTSQIEKYLRGPTP